MQVPDGYRNHLSSTTRFFRFHRQLNEIVKSVIPYLWKSPTNLSVLVVGGSLGCEAISFLIAMNEGNPNYKIQIVSVDLSDDVTLSAKRGEFDEEMFRPIYGSEGALPEELKSKYFLKSKVGSREFYQLLPHLASKIEYIQADMTTATLNTTYDIVFCQNVMIHMNPSLACKCLENILKQVSKRGVLICGGMDINERIRVVDAGFTPWESSIHEIHDSFSSHRMHYRENRGQFYFELEDLDKNRTDWMVRYSTIFIRKSTISTANLPGDNIIDHYLFNGIGAGNIGDETMFEGWLRIWSLGKSDSIEVWNPESLPPTLKGLRPEFTRWDLPQKREELLNRCSRVLLVGDTPIMEKWGLAWPMQFHSTALAQCKTHHKAVHAVGVGVDRIESLEAKDLFAQQHSAVESWTVRSEACRSSLLELGVSEERVRVAADLAWVFQPLDAYKERSAEYLKTLGLDVSSSLVAVNALLKIILILTMNWKLD